MIIFITGIPGAGKTSYLSKLAIEYMQNGYANYYSCKREFNDLNNTGCALELPPQKHLVYSDIPIHYGKRLQTYDLNGFRIGLRSPLFPNPQFFPPYSTLFVDEAQRYYDSRISKYLRKEVYSWYQFHRHMDYDIYLACQRLGNIDINIRTIAERFLVMESLDFKTNKFGMIEQCIWTFREFTSCDMAEQYMLAKDKGEVSDLGTKCIDTCDYNILNCYNSKSCRPFFYDSIIRENTPVEYYTEDGYKFTRESLVNFNDTHYFVAPQGYLINYERDKKILEKLGVKDYVY